MSSLLKYVISSLIVFLLAGTAVDATPPGFLEGHLKIFSLRRLSLRMQRHPQNTGGELRRLSADHFEPGR